MTDETRRELDALWKRLDEHIEINSGQAVNAAEERKKIREELGNLRAETALLRERGATDSQRLKEFVRRGEDLHDRLERILFGNGERGAMGRIEALESKELERAKREHGRRKVEVAIAVALVGNVAAVIGAAAWIVATHVQGG